MAAYPKGKEPLYETISPSTVNIFPYTELWDDLAECFHLMCLEEAGEMVKCTEFLHILTR